MTKTYCRAVARVEGDPTLVGLADILLSAWSDDEDHFQWVATAPPADLVAWADQIRKAETKAAQGKPQVDDWPAPVEARPPDL